MKASLEIAKTLLCIYLTRETFRIDMPVKSKTAPKRRLVKPQFLLQAKDDQHNESEISKYLMMNAMAANKAVTEQ